MTSLTRPGAPHPLAELLDWLDSSTVLPARLPGMIRVEDYTDGDRYVVRADIPGIDPAKDVEVSLDGDVLTIRGERREEERDKRHSELRYGSFSRSIRLPAGVTADDVTARYDAGVLEVSMPVPRAGGQVTVPVQRGDAR